MHSTSVINLKITILLLLSSLPILFLHFLSLHSSITFDFVYQHLGAMGVTPLSVVALLRARPVMISRLLRSLESFHLPNFLIVQSDILESENFNC